jgi:hypothetical protein
LKKSKDRYTAKMCIEELKQSGRRYKKSYKGHRLELYQAMQTAQRNIVRFSAKSKLRSGFIRDVRKEREQRGGNASGEFNLSLEAVAMATGGASSRGARQLASKRAKVLDLLRESEVPVNETAKMLKSKGITRLYNDAKKEKVARPLESESDEDRFTLQELGRSTSSAARNDKDVAFLVRMRLSDRDQVLETEDGAMLTMVVQRIKQKEGTVRIRKVVTGDRLVLADDWVD